MIIMLSLASEQDVKVNHENTDKELKMPLSKADRCLIDDVSSSDDSLAKKCT